MSLKRLDKTAQMRARLLAAALDVFSKSGYSNTSLRAIAKRAAATSGAIYYHFPSRKALLTELIEQHTAKHLTACETFLSKSPQRGDIMAFLCNYYDSAESGLYVGLLLELTAQKNLGKGIERHVVALYDVQHHILRILIGRLTVQSNHSTQTPEDLAAIVIAVSSGLSLQRLTTKTAKSSQSISEVVCFLLRACFGAGPV